ncbi:MAG TPA: NrfD/PsrC family molybdoenzyme membrane anchor subunit [Ktedonobacterales bacterium]|nr:NrfD/PsrC family molybdoenzyme membrane anchor subunit [Ktedonobacterales bacterium]
MGNLPGIRSNRANGHRQPAAAEPPARETTTYYDRPMIKPPTWRWYIPFYFFVGGIAGGAAAVGAAADLVGGARHRATVRHARYLSTALALVSAVLLIVDLRRPARFHHMLRVFKGSSPLSVGTWILSLFGLTSGLLAARQIAEDDTLLRRESALGRLARVVPGRPVAVAHGLLGLGLGGYTGTLLAATAVPLWSAGGVLLGPLFEATAIGSGVAALRLLGGATDAATDQAHAELASIERVAAVAQLGLVAARDALVPVRVNAPLRQGAWGAIYRLGAVGGGMAVPLGLGLAGRLADARTRRTLETVSAALTLAGALAERFALTEAGKRSALDPRAYQTVTRGAPGEARPTPARQAAQAPASSREQPYRPHYVVPAE